MLVLGHLRSSGHFWKRITPKGGCVQTDLPLCFAALCRPYGKRRATR